MAENGHTAENDAAIEKAAAEVGVTLLPWQRDFLRAALSGQDFVMHRGRKMGWTTVQRVAERLIPPAADQGGTDA